MRKRPTKIENEEVVISLTDVVEKLKAVETRLARIEAEKFGTGFVAETPSRTKPKKGRRPKLPEMTVVERRNNLTNWLEKNWPYLSVELRKAKTSESAIKAIETAKTHLGGVFMPPFYNETEKYEKELWMFLKSKRFYGNPRNLAGAMAGLPELAWKRSFDICAKHPCKHPLQVEAIRDYLNRRYPDRLRELLKAKSTEKVKTILRKTRTDDPTFCLLKETPEKVREWLRI